MKGGIAFGEKIKYVDLAILIYDGYDIIYI